MPAEARDQGHLRERRAVPPVPVSGRTGVPLQQPQGEATPSGSCSSCATIIGKRLTYAKLTGADIVLPATT